MSNYQKARFNQYKPEEPRPQPGFGKPYGLHEAILDDRREAIKEIDELVKKQTARSNLNLHLKRCEPCSTSRLLHEWCDLGKTLLGDYSPGGHHDYVFCAECGAFVGEKEENEPWVVCEGCHVKVAKHEKAEASYLALKRLAEGKKREKRPPYPTERPPGR